MSSMKSEVPRIIIKPRVPAVPPALTPTPTVTIPAGTSSRLIAPPPTHEADDEGYDDGMDVDSPMDGQTGDEEGGNSRVGTPRPRGRPRGRGRGSASGTSTPRVRGRGRGRGKARGGRAALTIRLPKRGDEEGDVGVEGDLEGEGSGAVESEAGDVEGEGEVEEPVKEKEKEEPLGGGKPFRKIQGKVYVIEGDEFITDEDPKGNEKIDHSGVLLGGRRFKASTFVLPNRHPTRQYMLAIDAARTSGFRDSLYYFRRNPLAFKLNATQPEKDYLIAEGKLGSHLRTRSVTLITARSAFKLHGSKMVIDGRWVTDDYYEEKTTEEITPLGIKPGDPVGELPDPNATAHSNEMYALAAATTGAAAGKGDRAGGGIYRAGGPTTLFGGNGWGPYSDGPLNAVRKSLLSRDGVDEDNWMFMMAMRVAESGDEWAKWRREGLKLGGGVEPDVRGGNVEVPSVAADRSKRKAGEEEEEGDEEEVEKSVKGVKIDAESIAKRRRVRTKADEALLGVYEPHSGLVHYRDDTQPTRSRWEALPDPGGKKSVLGGTKVGNGAWALAWVDTVMEVDPQAEERRLAQERLTSLREAEGGGTRQPVVDLTVDT